MIGVDLPGGRCRRLLGRDELPTGGTMRAMHSGRRAIAADVCESRAGPRIVNEAQSRVPAAIEILTPGCSGTYA